MKERQYEVEIYERSSHVKYGKAHYFGWILSSDKKENAESFALDILAGMTPRELQRESENKMCLDFFPQDESIGYERAEYLFSFKSRLLKP